VRSTLRERKQKLAAKALVICPVYVVIRKAEETDVRTASLLAGGAGGGAVLLPILNFGCNPIGGMGG
jgi:hypothetical protein